MINFLQFTKYSSIIHSIKKKKNIIREFFSMVFSIHCLACKLYNITECTVETDPIYDFFKKKDERSYKIVDIKKLSCSYLFTV